MEQSGAAPVLPAPYHVAARSRIYPQGATVGVSAAPPPAHCKALVLRDSGFPSGSVGKESTCNVGDLGSIPGLGRFLEKRKAPHSSILAWRIQ